MDLTVVKNATCTFCGCVCDDIELHSDGERITHTKAACVLGVSWFKNLVEQTRIARGKGVPIAGLTYYGAIDHVDWDSALRVRNLNINPCGMWGLSWQGDKLVLSHFAGERPNCAALCKSKAGLATAPLLRCARLSREYVRFIPDAFHVSLSLESGVFERSHERIQTSH